MAMAIRLDIELLSECDVGEGKILVNKARVMRRDKDRPKTGEDRIVELCPRACKFSNASSHYGRAYSSPATSTMRICSSGRTACRYEVSTTRTTAGAGRSID
jgi:hypothetical protein